MTVRVLPAKKGLTGLEAAGCGAWVGEGACNTDEVVFVMGGLNIFFGTYRCAVIDYSEPVRIGAPPRPIAISFLCKRHMPPTGLFMDISPDVLRRTREQEKKFTQMETDA